MTVRPTRLAFRGRVEASGLLLADSAEGRRRALACWLPGTLLSRAQSSPSEVEGLLVRFPAPERVHAEVAAGTVFVAQHGVWASAPLTKDEAAGFAPTAVLIARAGALTKLEPTGSLDAADWLDLSGFTLADAQPLPEPPRPIEVSRDAPRLDLRERVKDPKTKQALLDALTDSGAVKPLPKWKQWLRRAVKGDGAPPPANPNAWDKLNAWLSKRVEATKLGRWLIDRQSAYFDRLSKMFDDDLDAALRHAIALEGDALPPASGRALNLPTPRAGLGLNFGLGRSSGPAIQMEGNRYERLRAQYREAAKKLEAEGRIDEAAFVLTDLLNAPAEAVELFYRHQKYALAAQLAEGKGLEPALVVRLWFLAGDAPRAVRLARKTKTFATAISKLEGHPEAARKLRMLWADALAAAGDFPGAVRAAWNVAEAKALLLKWIDLAVESGGPDAARLALMRLDLAPEEPAPVVDHVRALLDDPAPDRAGDRQALGEALLTGGPASQAQRALLARPAARALARDRALYGTKNEPLLKRLLQLDEGALRTDMPGVFPTAPPRQRPADFVFHGDGAALRAFDAALLPGGRMLAALGENGLAVVTSGGRTVWRHDAPAFSLAVAPNALFAVTRTERGEATSLRRASLGTRTVEDWARVPLSGSAREIHGGLWMVGSGAALLALDALTSPASAIWQYPLGGGVLLGIGSDESGHAMLLLEPTGVRLHQMLAPRHLPQPIGPLWVPPGQITHSAVTTTGYVCVGANTAAQPRAWVFTPGTAQVAERVLEGPPAGTPAMAGARVAIAVQTRDGVVVHVTPGALRLHFEGARKASLRFQGDVLVVTTDHGRVVAFDCAETSVLRQLSVRP